MAINRGKEKIQYEENGAQRKETLFDARQHYSKTPLSYMS